MYMYMYIYTYKRLTSVHVPLWVIDKLSDISEDILGYVSVQNDGVDGPPLAWVAKLLPLWPQCRVHDGLALHLQQGHLSSLIQTHTWKQSTA